MKKLKSFLCLALMFIAGSMMLVACGPNNDNPPADTPTTTTITLAEAKQTIVNALAIDNTQVQTLSVALANESTDTGNRDLLEKLGKVEISMNGTAKSNNVLTQSESIQGKYEYSNGAFKKYLMTQTDSTAGTFSEYSPNFENAYVYAGNNVVEQRITTSIQLGYADTMGSAVILMLNGLFSDKAFEIAYEQDVTKNTTNNGYELVLKPSLKGYARVLTYDSMTDSEFEEYWTQTVQPMYDTFPQVLKDFAKNELTITFNTNDEIEKATMISNNGSMMDIDGNVTYYKVESTMTISKFTGNIEAPQWYTNYISSQN